MPVNDIKSQIYQLKQDIKELIHDIRCPNCHKLLAKQEGKEIVIRCGRCSHELRINS